MASKIFILTANIFFVAACFLEPTAPVEEPCFIADTVGRSHEIGYDSGLACYLVIVGCRVEQVCISRI